MSESATDRDAQTEAPPVDDTQRFASLLASGERVLVVRQRHWFTFIQAARWFVLVLVVGLIVGFFGSKVDGNGVSGVLNTIFNWGFGVFAVAGLLGLVWYYLAWRRERYLVTTRRVIEAGGVINKWSRDTSLSMITDMVVDHPLLGRILGYADIDLLTASEAGTNKIRYLPDADGFKRSLLDAKYEHELELGGGHRPGEQPVPTLPPAAPAPVAAASDHLTAEEMDESITRLADLRDRGLITPEEFEAKKRELLDRL